MRRERGSFEEEGHSSRSGPRGDYAAWNRERYLSRGQIVKVIQRRRRGRNILVRS